MADNEEFERETPVEAPPLPLALRGWLAGSTWHRNHVGEAGAIVHRLQRDEEPSLYLKHAKGESADALAHEFARLLWLQTRWPVPSVAHFECGADGAWLLTQAVAGRTAHQWLSDEPSRSTEIVAALGQCLARLHELAIDTCPFNADNRLQLDLARQRLDAGLIDADDFDDSRQGWTPAQVWEALQRHLPFAEDRVVTHGDFSLDNILLDAHGRITGIIDVGRTGIADRYRDLAILANCLDEFSPTLRGILFHAYGIATPDREKIEFHLLLDECF